MKAGTIIKKPLLWFQRQKWWTKTAIILCFVFCVLLFFANVLVRNYINSNGEDLIGRKIEINSLHFNYLTFSATMEDVVIYENDGKEKFITLDYGYLNFNPWAYLSNHYEASEVLLDGLYVQLIQRDTSFNFTDLFANDKEDDGDPAQYTFSNIHIRNSEFRYVDATRNNTYPLKNLNVEIPEIAWNNKKSDADLQFSLGKFGEVRIDAKMDYNRERYILAMHTKNIGLEDIEPFVQDLFMVTDLEGYFSSDIIISGSVIDATDIFFKGEARITDLDAKDYEGREFIYADSVYLEIDSVNIQGSYFAFGEMSIHKPFIQYSVSRNVSNFDKALSLASETSESTGGPEAAKTKQTYWKFERVVLDDGTIYYSDDKLTKLFNYTMYSTHAEVSNLVHDGTSVPVSYSFNTKKGGDVSGEFRMNVRDGKNHSFKTKMRDLEQVILPSILKKGGLTGKKILKPF